LLENSKGLITVIGIPVLAALALILSSADTPPEGTVLSWASLVDKAKTNPALDEARAQLIETARSRAEQPPILRVHRLEDVGTHRTWLDGRSKALEDEIRETFALAMSDFAACNTVSQELPLMAAAYRLTNDPALLERIIVQLEELATWTPLQRPGWTLYAPGHRLPADGKDGNWLATGCGVRAIGDALDVLPADAIGPDLRARLHALLEQEIASIVDDWETERSWFISSENPITNQWVLPTEGLVRACIVLGVDEHRDSYELGVRNLLMALDAHGKHGEFEEGFGYAGFTVTSMLHAAHAMAVAGDRRAIDSSFLRNFPVWYVHHFQPGDFTINCFDAGGSHGAAKRTGHLLSLSAACTGSTTARWALAYQVSGPSNDLAGLAAGALPAVDSDHAPPLFAYYERATRVNWRDSWNMNATGVWVRGGHRLDQHDHEDRGHVNFIARGRPILIEAGTPSYHHTLLGSHFASGVGHNILQLGMHLPDESDAVPGHVWHPGWQKRGGIAPLTVQRLDTQGGEVVVNGTRCYDDLARWRRCVKWTADELTVIDNVTLKEDREDIVLFRWHLGTEESVTIEAAGEHVTVSWPEAVMRIDATTALVVSQEMLPDHTLAGHTGEEDPDNAHTCLVIHTRETMSAVDFTTHVLPR
jgi:heparinase II/III-like protein